MEERSTSACLCPVNLKPSRPCLNSGKQCVVREVAVAHRALMIGMAKHPTDREQVDPRVDHKRRGAVAKVVKPEIAQSSFAPGSVPRMLDVREGLPGLWIG